MPNSLKGRTEGSSFEACALSADSRRRPSPTTSWREVLDIGLWTGSDKNMQPRQVVVVRDRDRLRDLADCGIFAGHLAGAAVGLVLVMDDDNRRLDEGRLAHNFMLAAWAYGIGRASPRFSPRANVERATRLSAFRWNVGCVGCCRWAIRRTRRRFVLEIDGVEPGRESMAELLHWETYSGS